jgi:hypothetical protein
MSAVIPISLAILVALFLVQYRGTHGLGRIFGPITAVWFASLGILGLIEVIKEPEVLAALSPHHAITFCATYKLAAFIALGSVVLAVTGAEALYADMGHFGARPIRFGWLWFVLPSLTLNYLGQGALLLRPACAGESLLPAGAGVAAAAAGGAGDAGHHHRQPGDDLGRLLHRPAMRADGLPAPPDRAPHQRDGGRARSTCRRSTTPCWPAW